MAESVKTIFKADNVPIEWEQVDVTGVESGDKHSEELFRESIASLKRNKLGLKGTSISTRELLHTFMVLRHTTHAGRAVRTSVF